MKLRFAPGVADQYRVTYENGAGCPHLHGNFGVADVEGTREFTREGEGESWEDAFRRQGADWLI